MAKLHISQEILDIIWPVGSVYLAWGDSTNPGQRFGGTWGRLKGGFIYGCQESSGAGNGTGTATKASSGNTGSTTLTVDQIPSHTHTYSDRMVVWDADGYRTDAAQDGSYDSTLLFKPWGTTTMATGGGKGHTHSLNSHTHNIPYIAVYAWYRLA